MNKRFLKSIRLLTECYQGFERHSNVHIQTLGLTPAQFDIIATLGNTSGMCFKELGQKTLITKGTLTGVIERLIQKKLVTRVIHPEDRRHAIVKLTPQGEREFERTFEPHIMHVKQFFLGYNQSDLDALEQQLEKFKKQFSKSPPSSVE